MYKNNLSTVPAAVFAVTPQTPEQEFLNLANLLANNQDLTINNDGTPVGTGSTKRTGVSQNPGSSLGGQQNVSVTTTDAKRFAGEGVPFSRPVLNEGKMDNVVFTADNMIQVSPVVPGATPTSSERAPVPSSIAGQGNLSATTAERFASPHWYESNSQLTYKNANLHLTGKQLWESEKQLMLKKFPQAKTGVMKTTGEVYWVVPVTIDLGTSTKRWTFMLKYDNNHPHAEDFGGSVKAIPMVPSIDDLQNRAKAAGRTIGSNVSKRTNVPHIWLDTKDNMQYLCTVGKTSQAEALTNSTIQTAAAVLGRAVRWAYYYEVGLLDKRVWDEFCKG